jgi:hypothetical protein
MGPTIASPGLPTYRAPKGWTATHLISGYPQAAGEKTHHFTPDITFVTHGYQPLADYVKTYQPHLVDIDFVYLLKLVDQQPFVTTAGFKGVRLHSIDATHRPVAEQFSYVFSSSRGMVLEFACACAPADAAHYAPIFDQSMKTVVLYQP